MASTRAASVQVGKQLREHIEIIIERGASARGELVSGPWLTRLHALHAGNVTSLFQAAGLHAEVAIGGLQKVAQLGEGEGVVHRQAADDPQPQALMDELVQLI